MERWPTDKIPGAKPEETRPFRFEDLNGAPEPGRWGPVYPALPGLDKWRKLARARDLTDGETCVYGAAIGAAIRALNKPPGHRPLSLKYTMPDYAAKCRAELAAAAERDNRAYRFGGERGISGMAIKEAYHFAMIAKREREAHEAAAETTAEIVTDNAEAMTKALAASRDAQAPRIQSPYDEALECRQRLDNGETMAAIATSLELPTPALIRNRLQLLNLIPEAVDDVRDGRLSANAAYGISLAPKDAQRAICDAIRNRKLNNVEAIKRAGREARKAA